MLHVWIVIFTRKTSDTKNAATVKCVVVAKNDVACCRKKRCNRGIDEILFFCYNSIASVHFPAGNLHKEMKEKEGSERC